MIYFDNDKNNNKKVPKMLDVEKSDFQVVKMLVSFLLLVFGASRQYTQAALNLRCAGKDDPIVKASSEYLASVASRFHGLDKFLPRISTLRRIKDRNCP